MNDIDSIALSHLEYIGDSLSDIQKEGVGYSEIISQWIIPIFIAFVAFALPMILQTVQALDNKYETTKMTRAFKKNVFMRIFWYLLGLEFFILTVWFVFQYQFDSSCFDKFNTIVELSLFILSILWVLDVIFLAVVILIYFDPLNLLKTSSVLYKKSLIRILCKEESYLDIIECLLRYSIKNNDKKSAVEIKEIMGELYRRKHKTKDKKLCMTPDDYQLILDLNELLCANNRWSLFALENPLKSWIPLDAIIYTSSVNKQDIDVIWGCFIQYIKHKEYDRIKVLWYHLNDYYNKSHIYDLDCLVMLSEEMCSVLYAQKQYSLLDSMMSGFYDSYKKTNNIFMIFPYSRKHFFSLDCKALLVRYISHYETISNSLHKIPSVDINEIVRPIDYYALCFAFAFWKASTAKKNDPYYCSEDIQGFVRPAKYNEIVDKLKQAVNSISNDEDIKNIIPIASSSNDLDNYLISLNDVMDDYCTTDNIDDSKKSMFDKVLIDCANDAIGKISIFSERKIWEKYRSLPDGVSSTRILEKDLFRKSTINIPTNNSISSVTNDIYCGIVTNPIKALSRITLGHSIYQHKDPEALLDNVNKVIETIVNTNEWIIITDCDKGRYVFDNHTRNNKYKNIEVYYSPVTRQNDSTCQIWIMKKEDLPYFFFGTTYMENHFEGYRLTQIDDKFVIRRLIYDIGNFEQKVRNELKKLQEDKKIQGIHVDQSILTVVKIPMIVIYNENPVIYSFMLTDIPKQWYEIMDYERDYDEYDDYYEEDNNSISAEEYNSRAIKEEEEIRKNRILTNHQNTK